MARMDSLKKSGVDLAKLGAAISAFGAGASASQINIAATLGQTTAENNALALFGSWATILQSIETIQERAELFAGGVSGACLSIAIMLKDTVVLISDVQGARDYITSGGLLGSKESYDRMMQLFSGVGVILTTNPLETLDLIASYYKTQLDGAAGEYADGNNFTAGVVFGKNTGDIYAVLRTLPEFAALANKLRSSGLATNSLLDDIAALPPGSRPDNPATYLSSEFISSHLSQFENGASYLVPKAALDRWGRNVLGRVDGQFVMPSSQLDDVLIKTNGDLALIEKELGIMPGDWQGQEFVRIDIANPKALNLRMPSGNETGANPRWLPGGKLPTGYSEAVINQIPKGSYSESNLLEAVQRLKSKP